MMPTHCARHEWPIRCGIAFAAALSLILASPARAQDPSDASFKLRFPDIQGEFTYLHDDNVSRGRTDAEILSDSVYTAQVGLDRAIFIGSNTRMVLAGRLGGDAFGRYTALGRVFGDAQVRLDYRASGEFDAATIGAFVGVTGDRYGSRIRRGHRDTIGATVQRPLTDRISVVALVAREWRHAESSVFEGRNWLGRLSVDYAHPSFGTVYATGDFRHGDTVSSGIASLENIDTAKVLVQDTAFRRDDFFSYRFDANTYVSTLGYNYGFSPHASIDLFWRRIVSRPEQKPSFATAVPNRYVTNQVSLSVLVRF